MTSQLYMIATPLGNLEDLTLRAQRLFKELDYFFAEDSREFKKLLNALGIALQDKRVFSYASHNMKESTEGALNLLREGKSIGFVTDRGTPGISDPGALLVKKAYEEGIKVVPIPGPSAPSTLLSVSGLTDTPYFFQGFLPNTKKAREELFEKVRTFKVPLCFFESPQRIRESALELKTRFPEGKILLGRELTKMFETIQWHLLSELDIETVSEKGEYVCIFVPGENLDQKEAWNEEVLLRSKSDKDWSKDLAARYGVAANEVYNALQQLKRS